ncbi:MAG TPA: hypothetical protein P5539_15520 [Mesotoga sp.]|mgnify:CR=1 FL=1|nr:hypothetical protein [Mesotoga sp.]
MYGLKDLLVDVAFPEAEGKNPQALFDYNPNDKELKEHHPEHTAEHDALLRSACYDMFTNRGQLDSNHRYSMKDVVTTSDLTRFIGDTITYIVREALEPNTMIVNNLFQEIRLDNITPGIQVAIGSIGAAEAGIVPEGGEGRIVNINLGEGDMVTIGVRKYGLDLAVTEEAIDNSQWDILGMWLRTVGRAMARAKEKEAMQHLMEYGEVVFSNDSSVTSLNGNLTGRNIAGSVNGSFTFNDMNTLYARGFMQGFTPDTLLIHPLAWAMWGTDPELREIVVAGARVTTSPLPQGSYSQGWADPFGGKGYRTKSTGNTTSTTAPFYKTGIDPFSTSYDPLGSTFYIPPRYLPSPMKVLVSHFVPYYTDPGNTGTAADGYPAADVIMADSTRCGLIVTRGAVKLDEWKDVARDIRRLKIREWYGFGILEQGKGIMVAKGAVIARNYVFENVNQATLAEMPHSSGLVTIS